MARASPLSRARDLFFPARLHSPLSIAPSWHVKKPLSLADTPSVVVPHVTTAAVHSESQPKGRLTYHRILVACGAMAVLALVLHVALAVNSANELTQVESIIATQSRVLAEEGTLYYGLRDYPYTVCAYMPSFYLLQSGLYRLGVPLLQSGRLISLCALLATFWLLWRTVELYTGDRYAAWTGVVLAGVTQLLLSWGTVGQSDMLAIACALASFYFYSRFDVLGESAVLAAGACALAGLLTKQTVIAAPVAIFLLLLRSHPAKALQFAGVVGGLGGALVLALNRLMDGRFLSNTLFANLNPFAWFRFQQQTQAASFAGVCLLFIVALGGRKMLRAALAAPLVYLGCTVAVFLATCGKIGSGSNYRIELTVALILCTCLALHALDFIRLFFRQSRNWVTLLLLPLGIYAVQNLRFNLQALSDEAAFQREYDVQTAALRPYLITGGRLLSTDTNAIFRAGRPMEVEPLIYRLLVEAGRVDPELLNRDLNAGAFAHILLYEDVNQPAGTDAEIPRLTGGQSAIIRKRYRLVRHVPGPYLEGVYLYEPRAVEQAEANIP